MKISFLMIVLNGQPFVKSCIEEVLPFAHEVIVVEGPVNMMSKFATSKGKSIDGTSKALDRLSEKYKNVKIIRKNNFLTKCQMQNLGLLNCNGNYVWLLDSDEFYLQSDMYRIFRLLDAERPDAVEFEIHNFFKGCKYVICSDDENSLFNKLNYCRRIFRFFPGYYFKTHRPPIITPAAHKIIDRNCTRMMNLKMLHFGYAFEAQVSKKIEFYEKKFHIHANMRNWYNDFFLKWNEKNRKKIEKVNYGVWQGDPSTYTKKYEGEIPNSILKIFKG